MKTLPYFAIAAGFGALTLVACGSSTTSSGTTGTTSASTSTSTTVSSSSGGTGCTAATAEDHTTDAMVTITFPTGGLKYSPSCIKVRPGTMVTFNGDFASHPLAGGAAPPAVDTSSPIKATTTGMTAAFSFATAGSFPYFCEFHYGVGMTGTIFVE